MDDGPAAQIADPTLIPPLARELLALAARARDNAAEDPFGNPVMSVALAITRRIDRDALSFAEIAALTRLLRDQAFLDRAARLAVYVGGADPDADDAALAHTAQRLVRPDPEDSPIPLAKFRAATERTRFSAVFTAHPTFSLPDDVAHALAEAASGRAPAASFRSHRPRAPTLEEEFTQASAAIANGRDALDRLNAALLSEARATWSDRWTTLFPCPVTLASWVGYDTDGRTDIGWWDTLRLRLRMKHLQLVRLHAQLAALPSAAPIAERVAVARATVEAQVAACPAGPDPDAVAAFADLLVGKRDDALVQPQTLLDMFPAAIARADPHAQLALCVARAGLAAHGLALAHTHVRLNGAQLHNAVRQRLGLRDAPEDLSHRRALLGQINAALGTVQPVAVDFGALLAEQASATRLMMTIAQIVKHVDGTTPIRFLIAETETGYTLLAALWLAKLFGVERHIEISPLFETADALERGVRVLEEALRSPHYRAWLQQTGRLALQFGYSDSGRYVGQLAASYLIERLRLKVAEAMAHHGLTDVELVLFDTHGESIGRGAHPHALGDRLAYLSPAAARATFAAAGIRTREESAFQGGDGYLLFGTPELALATVARIAEHVFVDRLATPDKDPIYDEPDFAADFFANVRTNMAGLVEDPGYAALLGAFGPALLDPTGSRPSARQTDGVGGPARIRHPRELRAIPNNAVLQQLGWCANTLQGVGVAASRNPELFDEMRENSPRFARALDLAAHALAHSDLDVLRAVVATLDPGSWLDRAGQTRRPGRRAELTHIARALERLDLWAPTQAMFRRIQGDHLALRVAWPGAPKMQTREMLLHALRLALIHRIWFLTAAIPDFAPRFGITRQDLEVRILRLDIASSLELLAKIFPLADAVADRDFSETRAPRTDASYVREHAEIFAPMRVLFDLVRELGTAVTHEVGAFG